MGKLAGDPKDLVHNFKDMGSAHVQSEILEQHKDIAHTILNLSGHVPGCAAQFICILHKTD